MRITERHTFFFSEHEKFSNWYRAAIHYHGTNFNCNEQFMMFCKAMLFGDREIATKILAEPLPGKQKALGRLVRGFDKEKWDEKCKHFVKVGAREKFLQHEDCYDALMATTGTRLVEASRYDSIWGCGLDQNAPGIDDPANWPGTNWLGDVLTELREELALLPRPDFGNPGARRAPARSPGP